MTLGELEALQEKELRLRTSVALQQYYEMRGIDSHAYLIEAQFYMRELEQRDSKRIAHRDYRMELGIMALIVVEIIIAIFSIWIGFREAKEQAEATHSQTIALLEVQRTSMAMSETLSMLVSTSQKMNDAIQAELALASRIGLSVVLEGNMLNITNTGPANVTLHGWRIGTLPRETSTPPIVLDAGAFHQIGTGAYEEVKKLAERKKRVALPFELYLEANDGTKYLAKGNLVGGRDEVNGVIRMVPDRLVIERADRRPTGK